MTQIDPWDPVDAYVAPIRSVLFIDDQFPTFAQAALDGALEAERARALWQACTARGWLCDIDNATNWTSLERQRRLASCDLLVLDYHLDGEDSRPSLEIIQSLARSGMPNLVVVYTLEPDLSRVLLSAATWARGMGNEPVAESLEALEDSVDWSLPERLAFLANSGDWKASLKEACEKAEIDLPDDLECVALIESNLRRDYKVEPSQLICPIEKIECGTHRWFQCGNLFLVVVGKPQEQGSEMEAAAFLFNLESAVRDWAPSWMACLVANSRRRVEIGAFRDDVLLPAESLQKGLLGYIGEPTSDSRERSRRATEVATHLLSRRSMEAAKALGENLLAKANLGGAEPSNEMDALHLNAFLCSEQFDHYYLHVGTIFALRSNETEYWVCVTPACDMVPRKPNEDINPWAAQLDPFRPLVAIRLRLLESATDIRKKALPQAHHARHLFFWDRTRNNDRPLVAACFQETADPNPRLEQMIAVDRAKVQPNGNVQLYRYVRKEEDNIDSLTIKLIDCEPVAQLRAPYAERVVHVVGGHVSRIGVNFVPFKAARSTGS